MRRFLLPVLILTLALLLQACGQGAAKDPSRWGNLRVTLENIQQAEKQWSANLVIHNPTDKMQAFQYRGPAKYTMIVTRDGETILRRDFEPMDPEKPEFANLVKGVSKKHLVVWTFLDEAGNRVPPGTYEVTVVLNAVVAVEDVRQAKEGLAEPPTLGPVKVTVP